MPRPAPSLAHTHHHNHNPTLPVPTCAGLQSLQVFGNQLASLPAAALAAATACRQLDLGGNPLRASAEELINVLVAGMPALSEVGLSYTHVDSAEVRKLGLAAQHAQRELKITCDDGGAYSLSSGEEEGFYGGYDSTDSDSGDDGCPRYSWAGCAYAANW